MNWLVADWRECLRWSSVRLHGLAAVIGAVYTIMPTLDQSIAGMLPAPLQAKAIGAYAVLALIFRLTKLKSSA